jgi:hypothetical protein
VAITLAANSAMVRSSASNPTISYASTPAVDSGLAVFVATFGVSVTNVTDNQGNTWTARQSNVNGSPSGVYSRTARAATSSGTFTVTVTSGGGDHQIAVVNFDGTDTAADPYDVGGNNFQASTPAPTATSAASTVTPCAVVGGFTHLGGTLTITPSDTQIQEQEDAGSGMPLAVQWRRDAGATGAKATAWTQSGSLDSFSAVLVLKEATGGGGPALLPRLTLMGVG